MKTSRTLLSLTLVAALAAMAMPATAAHAQEVQVTGPLAGQPAVRHERIYRQGRFEITPQVMFSFQDEYERMIGFGASATYHITDWLGIGAWGFYAPIQIDTSLTSQVERLGQTTNRNRLSLPYAGDMMTGANGFGQQVGQIQWAAALQLVFIPLRGKLSLFQKLFLDADLYISAGVAFVGVNERADVGYTDADHQYNICNDPSMMPVGGDGLSSPACRATQTRSSRVAITGTFAVGLRIYANEWMALNLEYRAIPFAWNTSGTDEGGGCVMKPDGTCGSPPSGTSLPDGKINSDDWIFHFNHMFTIGWTFYLPTNARISE